MKKVIETERLLLRELEESDTGTLAEIYSDLEVMRYVGKGIALDYAQTKKSVENWIKYYERFKFGNWATIEKGTWKFVGLCGLSWLPDSYEIEVSYLFTKDSWGRGYATEAAKAILDYGFNQIGLRRIVALVYPQNEPSIHVLEKLGMKYEGERIFFNDKLLLVYSSEKNET
jgi:ribosomal-protein-alanine N-acetyltransferase